MARVAGSPTYVCCWYWLDFEDYLRSTTGHRSTFVWYVDFCGILCLLEAVGRKECCVAASSYGSNDTTCFYHPAPPIKNKLDINNNCSDEKAHIRAPTYICIGLVPT